MTLISAAVVTCLALAAPADGGVLFQADFDAPAGLKGWSGSAGKLVAGYKGTRSLAVEQASGSGSATRHIAIPAEQIAGRRITLQAVVKAEGVSTPPRPWNGVKVMLILETKHGKQYPQLPLTVGTYDWTAHERTLRVPKSVVKATLTLGLEKVSGKAQFDDVAIRIAPPRAKGRRRSVMFRGHDLARLRGVMHGPRFNDENLRVLAREWKANHVRWQLNWTPMGKAAQLAKDTAAYDKWLDGALDEADKAVAACEKYGLVMLMDLHCPPGGRLPSGGICRLFMEQKYQDQFIRVWDRIARRYKGRKAIYAYDLVNEPVVGKVAPGLLGWRELAAKAIRTIRSIDPGKPVVFEASPWGGPGGFDDLVPLDAERVIYGFHMYIPHQFTHQGVHGSPVGVKYPGVVDAVEWNKEALREAMRPAVDFQRDYNVHMHVGEFSAIRWAPENSAFRYLRDVIDLFEEYGWDWTYHAYREWSGWSVEHGPDPKDTKPTQKPTDRKKLLLDWFAKNERAK